MITITMRIPILFLVSVLLCSAIAREPYHVAVIGLQPKGVNQNEADILSTRITEELFRTGRFIMVERAMLSEILKEQGFQQAGCTSDECAVQMGKIAGVEQIVTGTVDRQNLSYTLSLRLIDVATGQILAMTTIDNMGMIDGLSKKIPLAVERLTMQTPPATAAPVITPEPKTDVPAKAAPLPQPHATSFPFQIALVTPVQLASVQTSITGMRLNILYGRNQALYGIDVGVVNHTNDTMMGMQVGVVNLYGTGIGLQAGVVNVGTTSSILQVGAFNQCQSMYGLQIGVINSVDHLHGVQIGLVNISRLGPGLGFMPLVNIGF